MKHQILMMTIAAGLLCACGDGGEKNKLQNENDSIVSVNKLQSQILDDMTSTLVEVSACLDSISAGEGYLKKGTAEGNRLSKQQVLENLNTFKDILAANRAKLSDMEQKLSARDNELAKLGKVIKYLNAELDAKEAKIAQLQEELTQKNMDISNLNAEIGNLSTTISDLEEENLAQREIINEQETVYYVVGSTRELEHLGLLSSGGFLKKKKLDFNGMERENFTSANVYELTKIPLKGKSAKVLTGQPSDSYTISKLRDGSSVLEITNPTKFWNVSNFLIVQTK